jgi:hypothetical protein
MAANGQVVTKDIQAGTFTYDGVPNNFIQRGTLIDVPVGSALATALTGYITGLTTQQKYDSGGASVGAFMENTGINGPTGTSGMPYAYPQ